MRFGDLFYEIPEPETFFTPRGVRMYSFCLVQRVDGSYVLDVIPRKPVEDVLDSSTEDAGFVFRVAELGNGESAVTAAHLLHGADVLLGTVATDSVPEALHE